MPQKQTDKHRMLLRVLERYGDRQMLETVGTHMMRRLDEGQNECLERRPFCISTESGLSMCGRTAYRPLPYVKLRGCEQNAICLGCIRIAAVSLEAAECQHS
jgi:hypothetical protein